jgi:hypothetical protein
MIASYGKRNQRGSVLGITQNRSTRIVAKGLVCAGIVILGLLGALPLAATASAAEAGPVSETGTPAGLTPEPAPGSTTPVGSSGEVVPVATPPVGSTPEPTTPAGSTSEPTSPIVPLEAKPAETAPVTITETTPVETTTPVTPPTEIEPVETTTPVTSITEPPPVTLPVKPTPEPAPEAAPLVPAAAPVSETPTTLAAAAEATLSAAAPATTPLASALTSTPPAAVEPPEMSAPVSNPATAELSGALIGRLAIGAPGGGPRQPPGGAAGSTEAPVRLSAAQRAGELSCELSGMARSATKDCTAGWLSDQTFLSPSSEGLPSGTRPRTGPPADGYNGPAGGSHPVTPPPGPSPGGSVGGSATGASGVALSGFFTLAGLLLLAAPRAMRRLRLSCQPWRTAFFVLIPERPG